MNILLERGAHIDLQDNKGYTALMAACKNGHVETTSHLLDKHSDTLLRNSEGKTAFGLAMENENTKLLPLFTKPRINSSYPGIVFLEGARRETVTNKENCTINLEEVGLSLLIPKDTLTSTDLPLDLEIWPCFSGLFYVPHDVKLVSPAYILNPSRKIPSQKKVQVKMWHYANLETEKDHANILFMSASARPQKKEGNSVYIFKKMREKASFKPGEKEPVGQITLEPNCMLALGIKCKHEDDETKSQEAGPIHKGIIIVIVHNAPQNLITSIQVMSILQDCTKPLAN